MSQVRAKSVIDKTGAPSWLVAIAVGSVPRRIYGNDHLQSRSNHVAARERIHGDASASAADPRSLWTGHRVWS